MAWSPKDKPRRVHWVRPDGAKLNFTWSSEEDAMVAHALLRRAEDDLSLADLFEGVTGRPLLVSASQKLTLRDWASAWLVLRKDNVASCTWNDYRKQFERVILPALGNMPLDEIDGPDISRMLSELKARGLAKATRTRYFAVLHACLRSAQQHKKISDNPAQWVGYARNKPDPEDTRSEDEIRVFLRVEEYHAILAKTPLHYQPFVQFLAETGVRFSEGTALRVRDVDLENRVVHIRQAWSRSGARGVPDMATRPKSGKQREFAITQAMADLLKTEIGGRGPQELVFTSARGQRIHPNNFHNRYWIPAVTAADLKTDRRATPHHLRHSFASWMLQAGWSLEEIAKHLGHESIETTRKYYARFEQKANHRMADTMDQIMGRVTPKDEPDDPVPAPV